MEAKQGWVRTSPVTSLPADLIILSAASASSQTLGEIVALVNDPTGAGVPGASVALSHSYRTALGQTITGTHGNSLC